MFSFEFVGEVVDKAVVEVLTTQVSVTSGGLDLKDTFLNGQEGDIECTTTQVEDEDVALTLGLLVKTVGDGSSGGLVDDTEDVQASNKTGILCSLTLRVVEVGGDCDDGVVDGATEVGLSGLPHLDKDHGGNLLGCECLLLALELDLNDRLATLVDDLEGEVLHIGLNLGVVELASDEALCVENCVDWVHRNLVLRGVTDKTFCICEGDESRAILALCRMQQGAWEYSRRGCSVTLVVGNDLDAVISEDADTRVCGAKINTDGRHDGGCMWIGVSKRKRCQCSQVGDLIKVSLSLVDSLMFWRWKRNGEEGF